MKTNTTLTATITPPNTDNDTARSGAEEVLRRVNQITNEGLKRVITGNKNILASDDRLFRHPFGRDTAISADRLLRYDSGLVWQAALLMTATQGTKNNETTEEQPGKIFHELKFRNQSDPEQQAVYDRLQSTLGARDGDKFISYTSVDATPEFIHMVARYVLTCGDDILGASVRRKGELVTVEAALVAAVRWILYTIEQSDIGLIGAHRINPNGVIVPDLLDGATSFMHVDGSLVNYVNEVNTLNFQALGYQALSEVADIVTDKHASREERDTWRAAANELRQKTLEYFWIENDNRLAMAIDRDASGRPRQLKSDSILPAVALRTGIFDDRPDIVAIILSGLYTPRMMTCVGPRTQVNSSKLGYTRYQEPPWPVLVGRVVEGAIRYGYDDLAIDLIERMLMGIYTTGRAEEFHHVTADNRLGIYDDEPLPETLKINATNVPEAPQGWTVATMWWLTHEALPLLASRRSIHSAKKSVNIDLSLNKWVETVSYTIDREAALVLEKELLATLKPAA